MAFVQRRSSKDAIKQIKTELQSGRTEVLDAEFEQLL